MRAETGSIPAFLAAAALATVAALAAPGCQRREAPPPVPPPFQGPLVGSPLPQLPVRAWAVRPSPGPRGEARAARVILFWNFKDATSLDALAFVDSLARAYPAGRLDVVTIHTAIGIEEGDPTMGLGEFLAARGTTLAVGIDRQNEALHLCRLPDIPALLIADGGGIVRGAVDNYRRSAKPQIAAYIAEIVSGR